MYLRKRLESGTLRSSAARVLMECVNVRYAGVVAQCRDAVPALEVSHAWHLCGNESGVVRECGRRQSVTDLIPRGRYHLIPCDRAWQVTLTTQRTTKGFVVDNRPTFRYLILRNLPMSLPYCLP
jgi:hypothetical protein